MKIVMAKGYRSADKLLYGLILSLKYRQVFIGWRCAAKGRK